jgi:Methyltransferase domain
MRWQSKAFVLLFLSTAPGGKKLYRKLQDLSRSNRLDIDNQYGMKRQLLLRLVEQRIPIEGKDFLEVGTGWYPLVPLLLFVLGANRTVTIDLNPWMTRQSLKSAIAGLLSISSRIETDFALPTGHANSRLAPLLDRVEKSNSSLSEILSAAAIDYRVPCDACQTNLPDSSIDYCISSNVLEHIPKNVIAGMLAESRRLLRPAGLHLHHIDLGDHFAFDKSISKINFLRYSPRAWRLLGGGSLGFVNRLRRSDYIKLLEESDFEPIHEHAFHDPRIAPLLERGFKLHPDYSGRPVEDLTVTVLDIFARRRT